MGTTIQKHSARQISRGADDFVDQRAKLTGSGLNSSLPASPIRGLSSLIVIVIQRDARSRRRKTSMRL
jgi:hypothetical protein